MENSPNLQGFQCSPILGAYTPKLWNTGATGAWILAPKMAPLGFCAAVLGLLPTSYSQMSAEGNGATRRPSAALSPLT